MITDADIQNRRIETVSYRDPEEGSYQVEHGDIPFTVGRETRLLHFTRLADGKDRHWISAGRPITVKVGRGVKTYAVAAIVGRPSGTRGLPADALVPYGFNALNRQAYPVGFAETSDETNIRSGYGARRPQEA